MKFIAESDIAVQAYIDELLFEGNSGQLVASDGAGAHDEQGDNDKSAGLANNPSVLEVTQTPQLFDPANTAIHAPPGDTEADDNPFLTQFAAVQRGGAKGSTRRIDNRPLWGRENFSCLAFNIAGLKLAVPIQFVEGMQPLDLLANTPAPDGGDAESSFAEIMLGSMKLTHADREPSICSVVDTARLVMPERYDKSMADGYRYVLALSGFDWCLAVDSVGGEIPLTPQGVRWRSEHTRREWLAGTVVDKMCALIDIDALNRHMMADCVLADPD